MKLLLCYMWQASSLKRIDMVRLRLALGHSNLGNKSYVSQTAWALTYFNSVQKQLSRFHNHLATSRHVKCCVLSVLSRPMSAMNAKSNLKSTSFRLYLRPFMVLFWGIKNGYLSHSPYHEIGQHSSLLW